MISSVIAHILRGQNRDLDEAGDVSALHVVDEFAILAVLDARSVDRGHDLAQAAVVQKGNRRVAVRKLGRPEQDPVRRPEMLGVVLGVHIGRRLGPGQQGGEEEGGPLPVAGYDKGFFIRSADGNYRLEINGRAQLRYTFESEDDGDERDYESAFNVARAYKRGKLPDGSEGAVNGGVVGFFSLEMSAITTRISISRKPWRCLDKTWRSRSAMPT